MNIFSSFQFILVRNQRKVDVIKYARRREKKPSVPVTRDTEKIRMENLVTKVSE